jgi:hypothetical protein
VPQRPQINQLAELRSDLQVRPGRFGGIEDSVAEASQAIPLARRQARIAKRERRQVHGDRRVLQRLKFRRGFDESMKAQLNAVTPFLFVVAFNHDEGRMGQG